MLIFPLRGGGEFAVTDAAQQEYRRRWPMVDVDAEFLKALSWLEANPRRHKVYVLRFLVGWMNRARPTKPVRPAAVLFECPHTPSCRGRFRCQQKTDLDAMKGK